MLIERNLAPALTLMGAFIVLPKAYQAATGQAVHPSVAGLVFGSLLGAAGIFLSTLLAVGAEVGLRLRIVAALLLGALSLAFALGAGFFAFHAGGVSAVLLSVAALASPAAFALALVAVFRD